MDIKSLHHVAYRCSDAKETADFYTRVLGLEYAMALAEDQVPSTREPHPYMHMFFRMDDGAYVAFFELPESPPMGRDRAPRRGCSTSRCACPTRRRWCRCKARIESHGIEVLGPVDHGMCKSIYFFDPNGHRLELAVDTMTPEMRQRLASVSGAMLEEWSRTKKAPRHADWVHKK